MFVASIINDNIAILYYVMFIYIIIVVLSYTKNINVPSVEEMIIVTLGMYLYYCYIL